MQMLAEPEEIAREAADSVLGVGTVRDVWTSPVTDSDGQRAIRIVLAMPPDRLEAVTGARLLAASGLVHDRLEAAGEERRAIVSYTSTDDARLRR